MLAGLLGWKYDKSDKRFLAVNVAILVFGIVISATGFNPVAIIISAQVLNGVILPVAVIFLVVITSQSRFMREHINSKAAIVLGVIISAVTVILGAQSFIATMNSLMGG